MHDIAIRADRLSKRYLIGKQQQGASLSSTISSTLLGVLGAKKNESQGTTEEFWALRDVSFEVPRGTVCGIIGRNGAGKSTLLKILSRITEPTEGEVELHGRVASLLEVGTGFHPELTGRENIYLNGAILGMRRAEIQRKFEEIVAFAEIEKFLDTPVKRYSSGMYTRLAFAVAAHLEPEILVVDEVLAVGDAGFQKKCLGKMEDIGKEGRTVLLVSHNMPSIVHLCRQAVLLQDGRVVNTGSPADVVEQYLGMSSSGLGEAVWSDLDNAPGTDAVRLQSVRILQDGIAGPTTDVDIGKDVVIELTYVAQKDGARLYPAIWLKSSLGTWVLASSNHRGVSTTEDYWSDRPHPRGVYQSRCTIPANFLNDTTYTVTAILGKDFNTPQAVEQELLSFHVHDTGAMEYLSSWKGPVVRPRLAWKTERMDDGGTASLEAVGHQNSAAVSAGV